MSTKQVTVSHNTPQHLQRLFLHILHYYRKCTLNSFVWHIHCIFARWWNVMQIGNNTVWGTKHLFSFFPPLFPQLCSWQLVCMNSVVQWRRWYLSSRCVRPRWEKGECHGWSEQILREIVCCCHTETSSDPTVRYII